MADSLKYRIICLATIVCCFHEIKGQPGSIFGSATGGLGSLNVGLPGGGIGHHGDHVLPVSGNRRTGSRLSVIDQHIDHGSHGHGSSLHTSSVVDSHLGHGVSTAHAHGVIDRHVDPPFSHRSTGLLPAVHSRTVVDPGHGSIGYGRDRGISRRTEVIDRHIDPHFSHGSKGLIPSLRRQTVVDSHGGHGHGLVDHGVRTTVVDRHIDHGLSHGSHGIVPSVHSTAVDHGHGRLDHHEEGEGSSRRGYARRGRGWRRGRGRGRGRGRERGGRGEDRREGRRVGLIERSGHLGGLLGGLLSRLSRG